MRREDADACGEGHVRQLARERERVRLDGGERRHSVNLHVASLVRKPERFREPRSQHRFVSLFRIVLRVNTLPE